MEQLSHTENQNSNLLTNKTVAIIGGGPGGLSLARILQMNGVDVTVYERDASRNARIQGGSLDIHTESGQKLLQASGLMDEFRRLARPEGEQMSIYDKHGKLYLDIPAETANFDRPEIDRVQLRDLLLDSLKPDTVQWNRHFKSLTTAANGQFEILFEDGDTATADIVIGADGARSKIRPFVTDIKPQYSGTTIIECEVENPEKDCPEVNNMVNQGKMFVMGDSKAILPQQSGDGKLRFYITERHPENWIKTCGIDFSNHAEVLGHLEKSFEGWKPLFLDLFKVTSYFAPRPMYGTPVNQYWETKNNLSLIGDAAHVMPPFAGEGVNMAMLDAFELAENLLFKSHGSITDAIKAYEAGMFARTAGKQEETKFFEDIFHSPDGLEVMVKLMKEGHGLREQ